MTSMMMERPGTAMPGMGFSGMGATAPAMPGGTPGFPNWMMVPRCTFKVERSKGGMKIVCDCDDKVAAGMVQNLCTMLQGGMCTLCCMMNGTMVCCCNLTMGMCHCEMTKEGVSLTCTSGDAKCCEMIQACCDCVSTMLKCGCTCCMMLNNTPVCCGCC